MRAANEFVIACGRGVETLDVAAVLPRSLGVAAFGGRALVLRTGAAGLCARVSALSGFDR
jgi:hypothetical protein